MSEPIDWNALTPAQRNALVAEKVMGWESKECDGEIGEQPISPDGWFCQKCGVEGYWGDDYTHEEKPRRYSESMDAALLVIERFTVGVELHYTPGRDYCCKITGILDEPSYGIARSPAEAVCIAALCAVGIDVRQ